MQKHLFIWSASFFVSFALGAPSSLAKEASQIEKIILPAALESFEASGGLFVKDLNSFLVISDDTKKSAPLLFLMDQSGKLTGETIKIDGLEKITDLESISEDDKGNLYILSSLGLNKKGKDKQKRNLFVQATRSGKKITAKRTAQLRHPLLKALKSSSDPVLKKMQSRIEQELDIESHFVKDGILHVGLKGPQPSPGVAVIVSLGKVDPILEGKEIVPSDVKVWRTIDFKSESKGDDLLSELLVSGDNVWMSTTSEGEWSRLWLYDTKTNKLSLKRSFKNFRLEGIAMRMEPPSLLLLFDQGQNGSMFGFEKP